MDAEALVEVERRVAVGMVERFGLGLSGWRWTLTNFATFIDSANDRAPIAQRGHAKQKRTDLRLVGLGMVVSRDGGVPLVGYGYPGNRPDVAVFTAVIDELVTRWRAIAAADQELTVVFDAEPADTAAARGRKKRAKTDRADSRLLRELLDGDRVPRCWIPPQQVLEHRALLELYHDLRREHTAWIQRIHAVCFHQGAEHLGTGGVGTEAGRAHLRQVAAGQLSAAGQLQVTTYLQMLQALDVHLAGVRGRGRRPGGGASASLTPPT